MTRGAHGVPDGLDDDCLQQAAGPFPILGTSELSGDEVRHPSVRERQDLRRDASSSPTIATALGPSAPSLSSIAR